MCQCVHADTRINIHSCAFQEMPANVPGKKLSPGHKLQGHPKVWWEAGGLQAAPAPGRVSCQSQRMSLAKPRATPGHRAQTWGCCRPRSRQEAPQAAASPSAPPTATTGHRLRPLLTAVRGTPTPSGKELNPHLAGAPLPCTAGVGQGPGFSAAPPCRADPLPAEELCSAIVLAAFDGRKTDAVSQDWIIPSFC